MEKFPQIEGYRIVKSLGSGGLSQVYEAWDEKRQETVALKLLVGAAEAAPEDRTRFEREFHFLQQLQHRVLPSVYDCSAKDGTPYFTMEKLVGTPLDAVLEKEGKLSEAVMSSLFARLLSALCFIHSKGIVHRDLKPSNILIQSDGRPRLLDFGIARQLNQHRLTRRGIALGTPRYMSPEQVSGDELDGRSDLYSLGVILYQCIVGRVPYDAKDMPTLLHQILNEVPPPLPVDVNPGLRGLIVQLLAKAPAYRPASAMVVLDIWLSIFPGPQGQAGVGVKS